MKKDISPRLAIAVVAIALMIVCGAAWKLVIAPQESPAQAFHDRLKSAAPRTEVTGKGGLLGKSVAQPGSNSPASN